MAALKSPRSTDARNQKRDVRTLRNRRGGKRITKEEEVEVPWCLWWRLAKVETQLQSSMANMGVEAASGRGCGTAVPTGWDGGRAEACVDAAEVDEEGRRSGEVEQQLPVHGKDRDTSGIWSSQT